MLPLYATPWPAWDERALVKHTVEYGIQISGKIRGRIGTSRGHARGRGGEGRLGCGRGCALPYGKTVRKVIVVRNIVNIVVG